MKKIIVKKPITQKVEFVESDNSVIEENYTHTGKKPVETKNCTSVDDLKNK